MAQTIHENVAPLAGLVGTWTGRGHGHYPTIDPFDYLETATISHVGKPFLAYTQKTQHAGTGQPSHTEAGFWRMGEAGPAGAADSARSAHVELVVAQPSGLVEILEGTIESGAIRLRSALVGRTSTAKEVSVVERDFDLDGDVLSYAVRMSAMGRELTGHLEGTLRREPSSGAD